MSLHTKCFIRCTLFAFSYFYTPSLKGLETKAEPIFYVCIVFCITNITTVGLLIETSKFVVFYGRTLEKQMGWFST